MCDSSRPHGLQPPRLLHPWNFPGKSTGVGCQCLLRHTCNRCTYICKTGFQIHSFRIFPSSGWLPFPACSSSPALVPSWSLTLGSCHLSSHVLPDLQPLPPLPTAWNTASILHSHSSSWSASAQTSHPPGSFPCPHRVLTCHSRRPEDSSLLALGPGS